MRRKEIDISNYEEWFIDHLDGSLSEAEESQLKNFLILHPELSEELEGIDLVQLSDPSLSYPDKEELLMPTEKELAIMLAAEEGDKGLLSTLSSAEQSAAASLARTIVKPDPFLVFSDKTGLKKETGGAVITLWAMRFAAAASLIGVILMFALKKEGQIYGPRTAEVETMDLDEYLAADYSEFDTSSTELEKSIPVPTPIIIEEPAPFIAQEDRPEDDKAFMLEVIEEEHLVVEEDIPALEEAAAPEEEEPVYTQEMDELETPSPSLDETPMTEVADNTSPAKTGNTKEYASILDFLKKNIEKRAKDADILAMDDMNSEAQYVETRLKIGRFEISRKSRKISP